MDNFDISYNTISVIKSQVCSAIANSSGVRNALGYLGTDAGDDYDPEDPSTLVWNCIVPYLKDPRTIITTDPTVLVGVTANASRQNPLLMDCDITIVVVVHYQQMRTTQSYDRTDLLQAGVVCYTKTDWIIDEITKALSQLESKSWVGDIIFVGSSEASVTGGTHYARTMTLRVEDVNVEEWIHCG